MIPGHPQELHLQIPARRALALFRDMDVNQTSGCKQMRVGLYGMGVSIRVF